MGSLDRKEREKKEMVDLILLKAKEIMIAEGQDALSIRKIANEIEYSPSTIYLYFKDKDEILYQMMNKGFELMATYMLHVFDEQNPINRMDLIGRAYLKFAVENPDWYGLMFSSPNPMNHIKRCNEEWGAGMAIFDFFKATCKDVIQMQKTSTWTDDMLALHLWASVHGLVDFYLSERLCVVDHIYDNTGKYDMLERTLDAILLNIIQK